MKTVSKSSFTLFELLIVILIISIIYAIFVQRLSSKEQLLKSKGIEAIGELLERYDFNKSVSLRCTDKCKKCYIFVDGNKTKEIDSPFTSEPKVYDFDIHGILSQLKFTPIFDENNNPQEVCFAYFRYPNKSASSYIVEYQDEFYIFYPLLHPPLKVTTIQEAQDRFDPSPWIPTESGEYNF